MTEKLRNKPSANDQTKNNISKETKDRIIFAIVRFTFLLMGYIFTALSYSNFSSLCIGLIVISFTITSDYLILLLTESKVTKQFVFTVTFFFISILYTIILMLGSIGFIKYTSNNLQLFNISQNKVIYNFKILDINKLFILSFIFICVYIFEYTGILTRSRVTPASTAV